MSKSVEQSQVFELDSITDLIRLMVSRFDPGNRSGYLYYGEKDGKYVYFTTQIVPGWYENKGLPVTMLVYHDEAPPSTVIKYKSPTEFEVESWEFVENVQVAAHTAYLPIIKLKTIPEFLL
ncbi:MAG: hypothetical protein ACW99A_02070 [Candidatus Kariarchaeaceae archaeon]|jgi:hypothetical protein